MGATSISDLRGVLFERVEEMADSSELRMLSLELIAKVVSADTAYFVPFNHEFVRIVPDHLCAIGENRKYQEELFPAIRKACAGPERGAFVDSESFSPSERSRLAVYREVIEARGISSMLIAPMYFGERLTGLINLCRQDRASPFCGGDLRELRPLLRVIAILHASFEPGFPAVTRRRALRDQISPREREVAEWVARGFQNKQIAAGLNLSLNTVRRHVASIFKKGGLNSRTDLALNMAREELEQAAMFSVFSADDAERRTNLIHWYTCWKTAIEEGIASKRALSLV